MSKHFIECKFFPGNAGGSHGDSSPPLNFRGRGRKVGDPRGIFDFLTFPQKNTKNLQTLIASCSGDRLVSRGSGGTHSSLSLQHSARRRGRRRRNRGTHPPETALEPSLDGLFGHLFFDDVLQLLKFIDNVYQM